jgi:hypothetical protein
VLARLKRRIEEAGGGEAIDDGEGGDDDAIGGV